MARRAFRRLLKNAFPAAGPEQHPLARLAGVVPGAPVMLPSLHLCSLTSQPSRRVLLSLRSNKQHALRMPLVCPSPAWAWSYFEFPYSHHCHTWRHWQTAYGRHSPGQSVAKHTCTHQCLMCPSRPTPAFFDRVSLSSAIVFCLPGLQEIEYEGPLRAAHCALLSHVY